MKQNSIGKITKNNIQRTLHKLKMSKPLIISADENKKFFPGYNPKNAGEYHELSAVLADKWFENAVKIIPTNVILLAGGAASGKTEYLTEYIRKYEKEGGIFYDGTLPSFQGAEIKIKNALQKERNVSIHFIFPHSLKIAFTAFLNRERKYDEKHFYRTHCEARKTIFEVQKKYPQVEIRLIESRQTKETMIFEEVVLASSSKKLDFLQSLQYSEKAIIDHINLTK